MQASKKMKKYFLMAFAALAFCLTACDDDDVSSLSLPGNLTATVDETTITLSWDAVEGAEGYIVYYMKSTDNAFSKTSPLNETSYTLSGCTQGATYFFKVRAANSEAASDFTDLISVTVPEDEDSDLITIDAPTVYNIYPGLGWVNFTMDDYTEGECQYEIYDGDDELTDVEMEVISEDGSATVYSLTGLELGVTYTSLGIKRVIGDVAASTVTSFGELEMGDIGILTRNLSPCHLAFEWDDVAADANWTFDNSIDPLTRTYKLELATDADFENLVYSMYTVNNYNDADGTYDYSNWIGSPSSDVTSYTKPYGNCNTNIVFGQLEPATTYYFRVRNAADETVDNYYDGSGTIALNASTGRSGWSPAVTATTEAAHTAVSGELLFQGFDDHAVQQDHINCAAGVVPIGSGYSKSTDYSYPHTGEWGASAPCTGARYDELGASYTGTFPGGGESKLDGLAVYRFNDDVIPSMNGWYCAKACYPMQGALKLGGSSGQLNYIITPAFSDLTGDTSVTISCDAGACHACSVNAKLNIKIYRVASNSLETISEIVLPSSGYVFNSDSSAYHNVVEMETYSVTATLQSGDYVMFEAETNSSSNYYRLAIDNILIVQN